MIHKTVPGRHGTIHYWLNGTGDQSMVFTHGATMDHGLFRYQMGQFGQHFRVISWDIPAHGQSRPCEHFSLQNAADELVAILDAESIESAHLVGQSMGGFICQIVAVDHPERVLTLTAVGSSPVQWSYYSSLDRWLLAITPALLNLFPYAVLVDIIAKQITVSPASRSYALETLKTFTKAEIAHIMGAVYKGLLQYNHSSLHCPVLIVYGARDRTGRVRAYCDSWAAQESRELRIISDAAHNANMDNPEEFNRVLGEFLENPN